MKKILIIFIFYNLAILSQSIGWKDVSPGKNVIGIKTNGTLWYDMDSDDKIEQVKDEKNWERVFTASNFNIAMKNDGTLWAWGDNFYGQLGIDSRSFEKTPKKIGNDYWIDVSIQDEHTFAVKKDGTLWGWGKNSNNMIYNDFHTTWVLKPYQIGTDNNWIKVATAIDYTLALKKDGTLWAWGSNYWGNVGLGENKKGTLTVLPIQIGMENDWLNISTSKLGSLSLAIKNNGTLWAWGYGARDLDGLNDDKYHFPQQVGIDSDWKLVVSESGYKILALKMDGTLWGVGACVGMGNERISKFQQMSIENDWVYVSQGMLGEFFAIKSDNSLWGWGFTNKFGKKGTICTPVKIE